MEDRSIKSVVVLSGGQDSVTTYFAAKKDTEVRGLIHFQYGQQHQGPEFEMVCLLADNEGVPLKIVTLDSLKQIAISALTKTDEAGDVSAPHQLDSSLPASFVPGRNLILLTLAAVYAQSVGASTIWTGVCQTDYSGYPDCRADTMVALERALQLGMNYPIEIITPLMYLTKADTFQMAADLNVLNYVLENTHTCYVGNHTDRHEWGYGCGKCPACQVRANGWKEFVGRNDV